MTTRPAFRRPPLSVLTWVMLAVSMVLIVLGTAKFGISGLLLSAGAIGVLTALYSLITGRKSWAIIRSRTFAAGALVAAAIVATVGISLAPPSDADDLANTSDSSLTAPTISDGAPLDQDTSAFAPIDHVVALSNA